ncbi:MAG TPA: transcription elongation factor Spt5 [Nitrososphaera sp.]|nr:transcription elongation factor Spt5 [Nitrososphaera sp.]
MSDRVDEDEAIEDVGFDEESDDNIKASSSNNSNRGAQPQHDDAQTGAGTEQPAIESSAANSPSVQVQQVSGPQSDSKFFAIRTTGGQERVVANLLQTRVNTKKIGIRSVMVLDSFKGYIIVEAPDSNVAYEALAGIRHVRGQIRGDVPFKDIEGYLVKKPVVSELSVDDTVEVVAGPFKSMKAKITRVDYEKQEATVVLLDSPYQIPVTVDANYLKKVAH